MVVAMRAAIVTLTTARALLVHPSLRKAPRVVVRSTAGDAVTGTKFEESDDTKNPERRPGHQVRGIQVDEATATRQAAIRAHQEACERLTWAEEIRTMMTAQKDAFAVLSTIASKPEISGFPVGSIVGFTVDANGRPVFCFSGMSTHTKNLDKDGRCSLTVTEAAFEGAADARVVLTGEVSRLTGSDADEARQVYRAAHSSAYWVDFGDFYMYRMNDIFDIAFVGGFARAGSVTPQQYQLAPIDPLAEYFLPIATHMNSDHEDALKSYVEVLVGTAPVKSAKMKRLDRFGFDVRVVDEATGSKGVIRVPFLDGPVTERAAVKDAIVALSKKAAQLQRQAAAAETD